MHIRLILCHNKRRGMASILGTIIFVAILFSAFIPMYLTMKEADRAYDKDMLEVKRLDDERDREDIYAYVYPKGSTSDQVEVKIENICEVQVEIVRVWVNDSIKNESVTLSSMDEAVIGPYTFPLDPGTNYSYAFKIITARGNVYIPISGAVLTASGGEWDSQHLSINVVVDAEGFLGIAKYEVDVWNTTTYHEQQTTGYVAGTQLFIFDVTDCGPGDFRVKVRAKPLWQPWQTLIDDWYEIEYPEGPPDIWVRYSP